MTRDKQIRNTLASLAIGVAASVASSSVYAQCSDGSCGNVAYSDGQGGYVTGGFSGASGAGWGYRETAPLFDNYFTQGYANQATAGMYISPVGVPGWVGHTYITNQAFYPHQFLYAHHDRYHSYYDGGMGLNRTSAHYYSPPVRTGVGYMARQLSLPR